MLLSEFFYIYTTKCSKPLSVTLQLSHWLLQWVNFEPDTVLVSGNPSVMALWVPAIREGNKQIQPAMATKKGGCDHIQTHTKGAQGNSGKVSNSTMKRWMEKRLEKAVVRITTVGPERWCKGIRCQSALPASLGQLWFYTQARHDFWSHSQVWPLSIQVWFNKKIKNKKKE